MKGAGGLVWAVLFGILLLGFGSLFAMRAIYGKGGPDRGLEILQGARKVDEQAMSRLRDLGVKFADRESREPTLDLENPSEADFRFLEGVLQSNDPNARVSAAKVLRDIGSARSIEPLIAAVRGIDQIDYFMLECALTIVNRSTNDARIAALVPSWEKHRASLPEDARDALRLKMRDVGALDPAWLRTTAISHRDPLFRRFAVRELAALDEPPKGVLAAALSDADGEVRARALEALGERAVRP